MFNRFRTIIFFCFLSVPLSSIAENIKIQEELVVTASLTPVDKTAVGAAVTVITADDIERRGTMFLADILREVPGLAVNRSGSFGGLTEIRIRGAEANHTLVFIDGVEVNDPAFGSQFQFEFLMADNIERVEILRGAQSALWGGDAIGGVINIITKKGAGPFAFNAELQRGTFDTGGMGLNAAYGDSLINVNLSAGTLRTDGINIARDGDEEDGHRNRTYTLKLGFTPIDMLDLNYVHRVVKAETETDPQPFTSAIIMDAADNQTDVDQVYRKAQARLALFDNRWINRVSIEDTRHRSDFASTLFAPSFLNGDKRKYSWQSDLRFDTRFVRYWKHDVSFLYEYEKDSARGSFLGGGSTVSYLTRSYAGEYRAAFSERLFVFVGVRHDDTGDFFDDVTTWRITSAFRLPAGNTKWRVSYGTGVKNPTLFELFGNSPMFVGNPDLQPESSKGWDVGLERTFFDARLKTEVTYFRNRITDQITGFNRTVDNLDGTNRIEGLELNFSLFPSRKLDVTGAYTWIRADDADGQELLRRPKHIASLNLNYVFNDDRANINLGVHYNGQQQDNVFPPFPAPSYRTTLSAYTLLNLTASYRLNRQLRFFGRIENVLDESYEEVFGYTAPGIGAFAGIGLAF